MKEKNHESEKEMNEINEDLRTKNEDMKIENDRKKEEDKERDAEITKIKDTMDEMNEKNKKLEREIKELKDKVDNKTTPAVATSVPVIVKEAEPSKTDDSNKQGKMTYAKILQEQSKVTNYTSTSRGETE